MSDTAVDRYWIDSIATIGDGTIPSRDYAVSVHLAAYWGQDMSAHPVAAVAHPPRRLANRLRRGVPLPDDEVAQLGEGRWPLCTEAFDLHLLPTSLQDVAVKPGGTLSWRVGERSFSLRKFSPVVGCTYVGEIMIEQGPPVCIRQRVMHIGTGGPIPGVTKALKLISAECGLYDGGIRMLPMPITVDTADEAEYFATLVENNVRRQPVVAVACARGEPEEAWRKDVEEYARDAFTLQHAAAVTVRGVRHLREVFGPHALQEGAIKTYRPGFTTLDVLHSHPMTLHENVVAHELGRRGMLNRRRIRLMTDDAEERRFDPPGASVRRAA